MQIDSQAFLKELAANSVPFKTGPTTLEEQAWCRWFAREVYRGEGALVEWGPCMGSLTESYCEGLEKNLRIADKSKFAHVYDLFEWSSIFESWFANTPHAGRFKTGDHFRDYFCELHRKHERFLDVRRTDLTRENWLNQPIEWIINDAVKSLETGTHLFHGWVPWMIPGKSWIAHQDYLWSNNSFIQVYMFLMRDRFEFHYAVPNSCMVVFKNVKTCAPESLVGHGLNGNTLSRELITETFAWSRKVLAEVDRAWLALCESATLRDFGYLEAARKIAVDNRLTQKSADKMVGFQQEILLSWGYADILAE